MVKGQCIFLSTSLSRDDCSIISFAIYVPSTYLCLWVHVVLMGWLFELNWR